MTKTISEMELAIAGMEWGDEWKPEPRFPTLRRECDLHKDSQSVQWCSECGGEEPRGWVVVRDLETWLVAIPMYLAPPIDEGDTWGARDIDDHYGDASTPYEAVVKASYEALM